MPKLDRNTLEAALVGLEAQRDKLEQQIAQVRRAIGGGTKTVAKPVAPIAGRKKRTMSAAARTRIAAAQKKRWANFRKQQKSAV